MRERSPLTFRESVLSSLLLHAGVFIVVLVFPGLLTWRPDPRPPSAPHDERIPLEFLTEAEQPSLQLGDKGETTSSDPRPPDAPPPRVQDPYARGNNPNRFVAPPRTGPASPAPGPMASLNPPAAPGGRQADGQPEDAGQETDTGSEKESPATAPSGPRPDPAWTTSKEGEDGEGEGRGKARRPSLKDALGKMSAGSAGAGGAPLRYDNPVGGLSGPTGGLSFDTPGFDWGPYARKIYWIIWTNWTQGWPPAAWAGLKGMVVVRFRIHKDGTITGITVVDESGTPAFDTCATLALEASSPLPPLPEEFPKESEGITARFLYNLRSDSEP